MTRYDITVLGCDDTTRVFDMDMTDAEANLVRRMVAEVNDRSDAGCQPSMKFEESPAAPTEGSCNRCYEPITAGQELERDRYGEWQHTTCKEPW